MEKCIICGEDIQIEEPVCLLKCGSFNNGRGNKFMGSGGSGPRMYVHKPCIIRIQWEKEYPELKLETIYYDYLRKGIHKGQITWKFNNIALKNFTQEELDSLIPKLAKKLLKKE